MAINNFLDFNEDKNNMQTDEEYATDTQRIGGVSGIARAKLHNKLFRQVSVMAAAIGEFIKGTGNDASDADVNSLAASIANSIATKSSVEQINMFEAAGGTATAITLATAVQADKYSTTFIASSSNASGATTVNGKPLYKPGTTTAPNLISGRAYTIWYSVSGGCFFIKASAGEGNSVAADVLAGKTFSNDLDNGIVGAMPNRGAVNITPSTVNQTIQSGYHNGGGIVYGDADLISSNIKSGANIFGVSGKSTVVDTQDAVLDPSFLVIGYSGYDDGVKKDGTMPITYADLGDSVPSYGQTVYSGWDGNLYALMQIIPNSAIRNANWVRSYQPDLISTNILQGKSIFGIAGSAVQGKRWAGGSVFTDNPSLSSLSLSTVESSGGTTNKTWKLLTVGLDFKISVLVCYFYVISTGAVSRTVINIPDRTWYGYRLQTTGMERVNGSQGVLYCDNTGFKLPVDLLINFTSDYRLEWIAYE